MAKKDVLMIGHPLLRETCKEVYEFNDELKVIISDLRDTLLDLQATKRIGRAIAGPQIGYKKRVIFANLKNRKIVMVNPVIIQSSKEIIEIWDSCYSFDVTFFIKIKRNKVIKVRYQNEIGETIIEEFKDNLSELFQHEIDHLDGKLATDYLYDNRNIIMRDEWEKRYKKQG